MDEVVKGAGAFLVSQGPIGILCLVLMFACYRLFGLYVDSQDKRITEARESAKALAETAHSLDTLTDAVLQSRLNGGRRG